MYKIEGNIAIVGNKKYTKKQVETYAKLYKICGWIFIALGIVLLIVIIGVIGILAGMFFLWMSKEFNKMKEEIDKANMTTTQKPVEPIPKMEAGNKVDSVEPKTVLKSKIHKFAEQIEDYYLKYSYKDESIAGTQHLDINYATLELQQIDFIFEPDNEFDGNAIKIVQGETMLGYVHKNGNINEMIHKYLKNEHWIVYAKLSTIDEDSKALKYQIVFYKHADENNNELAYSKKVTLVKTSKKPEEFMTSRQDALESLEDGDIVTFEDNYDGITVINAMGDELGELNEKTSEEVRSYIQDEQYICFAIVDEVTISERGKYGAKVIIKVYKKYEESKTANTSKKKAIIEAAVEKEKISDNGGTDMKKVTYFDVEYANSKNKAICQMGLVCEDYETGEPYLPEKDLYINPEDGFDDICSRIHGITRSDVKDKPSFSEIWSEIEPYFTNSIVIGHNVVSADLDALVKALHRYNIDVPEIYYICTMQLAKEYVPRFAVENYSMTALCNYFDIDMDSEHNAFDDACANADLFKALVDEYSIDIGKHIKKYEPHKTKEFTEFVASPVLRKSISEFYGIIRGFSIDNVIEPSEAAYIVKWREENAKYSHNREIAEIITVIDDILQDGKITVAEIVKLQQTVKGYLDTVSTSPVTLSTQILNGIMQGIIIDNEISEAECSNLRQWLYDNIHLSGHYPFEKIMSTLEDVLKDGVVTTEEAEYVTSVIEQLLNPVESLKSQVNDVKGKSVCLSGVFSYGSKADVEEYIIDNGGSIDKSVKKTTDILLIGDEECQAYSNGTYGTKIKKAIEYNEKGCHIQIIKESDIL